MNAAAMKTELECEHVLPWLKRAVLGKDLWSAEFADGIYLFEATGAFQFADYDGTTVRKASPLAVIPSSSTPATAYEIKAGRWPIMQLIHAINAWLAQAKADAGIAGTYTLSLHNSDPSIGTQWRIRRNIPGTTNNCTWWLTLPNDPVWRFFGRWATNTRNADGTVTILESGITHDTTEQQLSAEGVLRFVGNNGSSCELTNERGTWVDQTDGQLPSQLSGALAPTFTSNLGLIMIDGKQTAVVARTAIAGDPVITSRFERIAPFSLAPGSGNFANIDGIEIKYDDPRPKVQQIFVYVDAWGELLKKLYYSTATPRKPTTASSRAHDELVRQMRELGPEQVARIVAAMPEAERNRLATYQALAGCRVESALPPLELVRLPERPEYSGADCSIRAVSLATERSYAETAAAFGRHPQDAGFAIEDVDRVLRGFGWRRLDTWANGQHVHLEDLADLPRVVVQALGHCYALVGGRVLDVDALPESVTRQRCCLQAWIPAAERSASGDRPRRDTLSPV